MHVVDRLIRDHRVAVIPGTTFGIEEGCYLRLAFAALDRATVAEGMGRFVTGLKAVVNHG
jgi:aspartate/methionine/tyrosine aminotransferase